MERRGRRGRLEARLDLRPEAAQELDVVRELGLALAFRVRSQDEPARRKRDGAERRTEPVPLALVADPARDADMAGLGPVNQVAAGAGGEGGGARPPPARAVLWPPPPDPPG